MTTHVPHHPCIVDDDLDSRPGSIWNLSDRGAYLVMDPMPPLGERLWISFSLPGDTVPVRTQAVVVWRNRLSGTDQGVWRLPPGCGLQFVGVGPGDRKRLETGRAQPPRFLGRATGSKEQRA